MTSRIVTKEFQIGSQRLIISDLGVSTATDMIAQELASGNYQIEQIPFQPGDKVIDIGGHVGMTSIYLAKLFPFIDIYTYEPTPLNFKSLKRNLVANEIHNVIPHNVAVSFDGRELAMAYHPDNTGGATAVSRSEPRLLVPSVPFDSIFETYNINPCKLLKIDCEGLEHEILLNSRYLSRVERLTGEYHINGRLREQGYSIPKLFDHLHKYIKPEHISGNALPMCE